LFVKGEWGSGKSHFLAFARMMARKRGAACSSVSLNAGTAPLNYPQRIYPLIAANLQTKATRRGLRALLNIWLRNPGHRQRLLKFSEESDAGDLSWPLQSLISMHTKYEIAPYDSEWAWTTLLGGDLSWANYGYKRARALNRLQSLATLFRFLGFGGFVLTLDEAETIDQLWSIRSRLVAYDVMGRLCSIKGVWCVIGITERFQRTIDADIGQGVATWSQTSEAARWLLNTWAVRKFEVVAPPEFDRNAAAVLAKRVSDIYSAADSALSIDDRVVRSVIAAWAQNPSRDPRRLIRLIIHHLDIRRPI
jgi:hypothetical protein